MKNIYFMSVQPDEFYFVWQLELQLFNFKQHGINPNNIHVLIVYQRDRGVSDDFIDLAERFSDDASFFFYEDTRLQKNYIPSLRPNALKQHFDLFKELSEVYIFYHDSDIIFRSLPNFEKIMDDGWVLSDTRSYLSSDVLRNWRDDLFSQLCMSLQIEPALIKSNDDKAGGAQYLFSHINSDFWRKIEVDSELIYTFLEQAKQNIKAKMPDSSIQEKDACNIQSWCADMWAILWNGFAAGIKISLSAELDFCWPKEKIKRWYETKIYHNSGVTFYDERIYFNKQEFVDFAPFGQNFDYVDQNTCSIQYVRLIQEFSRSSYNIKTV